ncbi:MAG TPA: NrfD/PsrC family molybdoenzyme membrane anchor subunit [Solirubrobacteraceae bacterium]|nr:NrfD/PsrC family molybdoenzyme membrane anchor subunit [Solirubrobacteraceae bacterium]
MSREHGWEGGLEHGGEPAELAPEHQPPDTARAREAEWVADHDPQTRDIGPALGTPGGPGAWTAAEPGARVALARADFGDARWSYLYKARDTGYADAQPASGQVAAANRRMRGAPVSDIRGPFIHAPSWGWEVATYFWLGGMASGSAFVALACDVAGDHRSAAIARKVALGAVAPAPVLLIADLGRPERFLNMTRVFKPRSPMNTGAWCLLAFSGSGGLAVGCDLFGRPGVARRLGALTALLGSYLGSYTGVLLACSAVPLWSRSRTILGPAFVATATATGAAATRLVLVASGLPHQDPTRRALGTIETASMLAELSISALGERRLGDAAKPLSHGRPGLYFRTAKSLVTLGFSLRLLARRTGPREHELASLSYLVAGLLFRFAWVYAGRASASDDEVVAAMARDRGASHDGPSRGWRGRALSVRRSPLRLPDAVRRTYGEAIRLTSLAIERRLRG